MPLKHAQIKAKELSKLWRVQDVFHGVGQKAKPNLNISFGSFKPKDVWRVDPHSHRKKSNIFDRFV